MHQILALALEIKHFEAFQEMAEDKDVLGNLKEELLKCKSDKEMNGNMLSMETTELLQRKLLPLARVIPQTSSEVTRNTSRSLWFLLQWLLCFKTNIQTLFSSSH